jgi:hypothetical protein
MSVRGIGRSALLDSLLDGSAFTWPARVRVALHTYQPGRPLDPYSSLHYPWPRRRPMPDSMPTPSVGRTVHYVSYGTPGGEYTSECRAATITEVSTDPAAPDVVGLAVLNPLGMFFHPIAAGGCPHDETITTVGWTHDDDTPTRRRLGHRPGTWHWPERPPEGS